MKRLGICLWKTVGRTPWSAADALVGLSGACKALDMKSRPGGRLRTRGSAPLLPAIFLIALFTAAADSGLRGPVAGFVFDPRSHSIRPINGMPGSSTLGPALDLPFAADRAVFSGNGDAAVVFSAGAGGTFLVRGLRQPAPEIRALPISVPAPVSAVFNATGSAAVFFSPSERRVQIVSGLTAGPATGPLMDVSALQGSVTSAALDASGSTILLGMAESGAGAVFLLRATATGEEPSPRFLVSSPSPAALLFVNGDRDALVADRSSNELILIQDAKGSADVFVAATERDGLATPIGLQLSADEKSVLAANAASGSITVHGLFGQAPATRIELPLLPSRFERLNSEPVLVLNEIGSGPLFLLDEAGGRQVYFVPVE